MRRSRKIFGKKRFEMDFISLFRVEFPKRLIKSPKQLKIENIANLLIGRKDSHWNWKSTFGNLTYPVQKDSQLMLLRFEDQKPQRKKLNIFLLKSNLKSS